jgi:hypothetical protein
LKIRALTQTEHFVQKVLHSNKFYPQKLNFSVH